MQQPTDETRWAREPTTFTDALSTGKPFYASFDRLGGGIYEVTPSPKLCATPEARLTFVEPSPHYEYPEYDFRKPGDRVNASLTSLCANGGDNKIHVVSKW